MREEFICSIAPNVKSRITPAHAGRIMEVEIKKVVDEDHPRACGKNLDIFPVS